MTMPELSNCPHNGDGWCLECVGELASERDALPLVDEMLSSAKLTKASARNLAAAMGLSLPSQRRLIGPAIRNAREEAGLSVRDLAKRVGVSFSYLSKLERGKALAGADMYYRIAEAMGTTIDALMGQPALTEPDPCDIMDRAAKLLTSCANIELNNRRLQDVIDALEEGLHLKDKEFRAQAMKLLGVLQRHFDNTKEKL